MQPSSLLIATSIAIAVTAAACAGDPPPPPNGPKSEPTVTIPPETKLLAAPTTEPEDLPGVDTSELTSRERGVFWRWASQLYAPCPEVAVSVAACVKEDRPCASCAPAARFLAGRARAGDGQSEAIVAFTVRFGPEVKKIDLGDSPVKGKPSAPVTIVVWSDYECPACGYAVPMLDELLEKHPDEVRLVHKLYPLNSHPHSRPAARAALAAKKQGKYWEMEKVLFSHQRALEDADLSGYAKEIGLDMAKFQKDFADPKADEIIDRDRAEADKHGLSGTPFIVINGREFDLGLFKLDRDLESWIATEVEIQKKDAQLRAIAAVGATLTGEGRGPVGPMSTGVPAASAAPVTPVPSTTVTAATAAPVPAATATAGAPKK